MSDTKSVAVVRDPTGRFSRKARFSVIEWAYTDELGAWSEGMEFRVTPRDDGEPYSAKVVNGRLVREDGRHMKVRHSGTYKWVGDG